MDRRRGGFPSVRLRSFEPKLYGRIQGGSRLTRYPIYNESLELDFAARALKINATFSCGLRV